MENRIVFIILAAIVTAVMTISIHTPLALAAKSTTDHARSGLDKADENVHENTGLASNQDVRFHEGLCQGGHSTTVLDSIGGCSNPIITKPGNSDNHRQDN